jgi:hypothetical protein
MLLFPLFLLVMLIPWLIAANLWILSSWFNQKGWQVPGTGLKWFAISLGAATAFITVWAAVMWLYTIVQSAMGKFSFDDKEAAPGDEAPGAETVQP